MATSSTAIRYGVEATTGAAKGVAVLLGRLLFVAIFVMSGPRHFSSQVIGYAASQGVPWLRSWFRSPESSHWPVDSAFYWDIAPK
jgi:hypothetical protein